MGDRFWIVTLIIGVLVTVVGLYLGWRRKKQEEEHRRGGAQKR